VPWLPSSGVGIVEAVHFSPGADARANRLKESPMSVHATIRRFVTDLRNAWSAADPSLGGPRLRDYPIRRP
jgi:hypothetical protein